VSEHEPPRISGRGAGRFELLSGAGRRLAYAARAGSVTWVFLDGHVYVIEPERSSRTGTHSDDLTALSAPMPATVVSVAVSPGDQVSAGDLLVTVEAMKMELAIKAPRDATVRRVACQPGELVQPGVPLVELE
jgi:biotin carboxyl carrier protein